MLQGVQHGEQAAPGIAEQGEAVDGPLFAERLEIGDVLLPADRHVARDGRAPAATLVIEEQGAAVRQSIVLRQEVRVVRAWPAVQHDDRWVGAHAPSVEADAVQVHHRIDRLGVLGAGHGVTSYTVMKPLRLPPVLTAPGIRRLGLADVAILCLLGGAIAALVAFAREFEAPFRQAVQIDLRPSALPRYTLYSLARGVIALAISYLFALGFGWAAAKSRAAERVLLPMLDILQSIPVLGFLPGLVLGLMSLFPTRNIGLELAAILMIFTAQAWNLALSFYNSLKSLPDPLRDACRVAGWRASRTFWQLEVPAAAQGLVWTAMRSMAGGWFFLMVNEAFRLGDRDFRLPGIGSYMSVAVEQGRIDAMLYAILAMVLMIVLLDQLLWRPVVVWAQKFRVEESGNQEEVHSWFLDWLRRSRLLRWLRELFQRLRPERKRAAVATADPSPTHPTQGAVWFSSVLLGVLLVLLCYGAWKLVDLLQ